jgi:Xaa-Pro aminopeptidase
MSHRSRLLPEGVALSRSPQSPPRQNVDLAALRAWRLARLRDELRARDYAGALLYDPINIRYAADARNMQVWCLHNAVRYVFVPTEGPVVLFDFHNCAHLSAGNEVIAEVRPAVGWFYFAAGDRCAEFAARWAGEVAELVTRHGGGNRRLAIDKCEPLGIAELARHDLQVFDGQEVMERARRIKGPEEVACLRASVAVCEEAMAAMRHALTPGMSENELWAILNQVNAARGGEWIGAKIKMNNAFSDWNQGAGTEKPITFRSTRRSVNKLSDDPACSNSAQKGICAMTK